MAGNDAKYISIPESEYKHLKQCEIELNEIYTSMQNSMQNQLNNAFQGAQFMQQLVDNMKSPMNNWF